MTDLYCEPCMFVKLESIPADLFCEDCHERYCENCALEHAKFRVFRNHKIATVDSSKDYEIPQRNPADESSYCKLTVDERLNEVSTTFNYINVGHATHDIRDAAAYNNGAEAAYNNGNDVANNIGNNVNTDKTTKNSSLDESQSFQVRLVESECIARIKTISKSDISGSVFTLVIGRTGFSLLLRETPVFHCLRTAIRRYGKKDNIFAFEVGRQCEYGPGNIKVKSERAADIMKACNKDKH